MEELFELSFTAANILPTVLLLFTMLYWVVFMLGFLDFSFLDIGHEVEADLNMEGDMDHDIGHKETGFGGKFLDFFNIGAVPFMVFFSAFSLFYWTASILGNYYWAEGSTLKIVAVLAAGLIPAMLSAKLFTQPFRKVFRSLNTGEPQINLIGQVCTLDLGIEPGKLGQAMLIHRNKHILVSVKGPDSSRIPKGSKVVVMEKLNDADIYLVERLELEHD